MKEARKLLLFIHFSVGINYKPEKVFTILFLCEIAGPIGMLDYKGGYGKIDGENRNVEIPKADGFYQYGRSKSKFPG